MKRTLELTHEEIEIIKRALGIAEVQFSNLRKQYIDNVVKVRGVDSISSIIDDETNYMFKKENEFCDLLLKIDNGESDV